MMKYTKLESFDLIVSRICMGCMGFGDPGRGRHPLAGVMAQNKPAASKEKHVWSTGDQKIGK